MSFHEYNADYFPPMPVCRVYLGSSNREPVDGPFDALLDTGADLTVTPTHLLRQIGAWHIGQSQARNLWGDVRKVDTYSVALALNGLQFKALQLVAHDWAMRLSWAAWSSTGSKSCSTVPPPWLKSSRNHASAR